MRILFINDYKSHGGAENYLRDVMAGLDENYDVKLLTLAGEDSDIGFRETGLLSYVEKYFSPSKRKEIRQELIEFDPDVIHVHNVHKGTIPTLRILDESDVPVIKTFHDYGYFCVCPYAIHGDEPCEGVPEKCWSDGEISFKQYLFRKPLHVLRLNYLRSFNKILAPSQDLKSLIDNFADAEVLPNFVDTEKFHPAEDVEKEGILFVGRVTEEKGIGILIDAIADTDISGKVVGKGKIEKYRKIADEKNADLDFKGYKSGNKLINMYQQAECTAIPSISRESFNLVGLESLACGTPVVASDQGGMQEYVEEGRNGYLFERGNPRDLLAKIRQVRDEDLGSDEFLADDIFRKENHMSKLESIYEGM